MAERSTSQRPAATMAHKGVPQQPTARRTRSNKHVPRFAQWSIDSSRQHMCSSVASLSHETSANDYAWVRCMTPEAQIHGHAIRLGSILQLNIAGCTDSSLFAPHVHAHSHTDLTPQASARPKPKPIQGNANQESSAPMHPQLTELSCLAMPWLDFWILVSPMLLSGPLGSCAWPCGG